MGELLYACMFHCSRNRRDEITRKNVLISQFSLFYILHLKDINQPMSNHKDFKNFCTTNYLLF